MVRRGPRERRLASALVKLRMPSFDHGRISFFWALGLGLFIFLGAMSVGVSRPAALIFASLAAAAIYFYVRLYGEEELGRRGRRP